MGSPSASPAARLDLAPGMFGGQVVVPIETARFTKDQEMLRGVTQIMGERVALAQRLRQAVSH